MYHHKSNQITHRLMYRRCVIYVLIAMNLDVEVKKAQKCCSKVNFYFVISSYCNCSLKTHEIVMNLAIERMLFCPICSHIFSNIFCKNVWNSSETKSEKEFPENEAPQNMSVFLKSRMNTAKNTALLCVERHLSNAVGMMGKIWADELSRESSGTFHLCAAICGKETNLHINT